jgi:hypothetical protein
MEHDFVKSIEIAKRIADDENKKNICVNQAVNNVFTELVTDVEDIEVLRSKLAEKEHLLEIDTTLSFRERSAHRAHITMFKQRIDRLLNPSARSTNMSKQPSTYDRKGKNDFRDKVIDYVRGTLFDENEYILALESPELLFVKKLPRKKFVIYEHDVLRFCQIRDNVKKWKYSNVEMRNGDIRNAVRLLYTSDITYKFAFLDFCNTLDSNIDRLKDMADALDFCEYIAFTFCLRGKNKTEMDTYSVNIVKTLQYIFRHHEIEYFTSYRDGAPMAGIILKRFE